MAVTVWQKPIINSVLLPAHAQPSGNTTADPANPSGQAGESGQTGQTEQGQTNQEQTAVPQQNQQEQQQNPGEPNHDRLESLPAGGGPIVRIRECGGAIQIVSYGFADRYNGPGQIDKDYWIKVTGIRTPIVGNPMFSSSSLNRAAPLALRLVFSQLDAFMPLDLSVDAASGAKNAQPARNTGKFTAFFRNWSDFHDRPWTQAELNAFLANGTTFLLCDGSR